MAKAKTTTDLYPDTVDHYAIECEARRLRAETISALFTALVARLSGRPVPAGRGRTA
jgi:hypothetical protein